MSFSDLSPENEYRLIGNTDGTLIGNVGDRLKVDSRIITPNNAIFEDAQLTRETSISLNTWTSVYYYEGYGEFYGMLVTLEGAAGVEGNRWYINLVLDGNKKIFGNNGLLVGDLTNKDIYSIIEATDDFCGLNMTKDTVRLTYNNPIYFNTSIKVEIYRIISIKKFRAGLVKIAKGV